MFDGVWTKSSCQLSVVTDGLKAKIEVKHHKDRLFTIDKLHSFLLKFIRWERQYRSGNRDGVDFVAWQIYLLRNCPPFAK